MSPSLANFTLLHQTLVKNNGITWGHRMTFHHLNMMVTNNGCCNYFHLKESRLLAEATSWSCIKGYELVRWDMYDSPLLWNRFLLLGPMSLPFLPIAYRDNKASMSGLMLSAAAAMSQTKLHGDKPVYLALLHW